MFLSRFSLLAYFLYSVTLIELLERKCVLYNLCLVLLDLRNYTISYPPALYTISVSFGTIRLNCLISACLSAIDCVSYLVYL